MPLASLLFRVPRASSRSRSLGRILLLLLLPFTPSNACPPTMGSDEAPTATTLAPPLTDPYSWFDFYDRDASNTLDQEEVISGLHNTLQIAQKNSSSASADASTASVDAIRESIQAIWPAFDIDGNGQVSLIWGLDTVLVLIYVFFAERPHNTPRRIFCLAATYCLVRAYTNPNKLKRIFNL